MVVTGSVTATYIPAHKDAAQIFLEEVRDAAEAIRQTLGIEGTVGLAVGDGAATLTFSLSKAAPEPQARDPGPSA